MHEMSEVYAEPPISAAEFKHVSDAVEITQLDTAIAHDVVNDVGDDN